MSTILATHYPASIIPALAGVPPFSLAQPVAAATLRITVSDFNLRWTAPLVRSESTIESEKAVLKFALDEGVSLVLRLTGRLIDDETRFQPERGQIETEQENACDVRAQFVGSTLIAAFGLASEVRFEIPELGLSLQQHYDLPLPLVSHLLGTRQSTFGLMVIERATGKRFSLPSSFIEEDVMAIALAQRAIVLRSFVRHVGRFRVNVPAKKEFSGIPQEIEPSRFQFPLNDEEVRILDQSISLGTGQVTIEKAVIENVEELRLESAKDDGHEIKVYLRSLTGEVQLDFPKAPLLPSNPWDDKIEILISLEEQLGARLANRINAVAARTLAGLTDEEKAEATERTEIELDDDVLGP
jgi:hypothetical protein